MGTVMGGHDGVKFDLSTATSRGIGSGRSLRQE